MHATTKEITFKMKCLLQLFAILSFTTIFGQAKIKGQVIDIDTAIPVAFATITHQKQILKTDWEGKFVLENWVATSPIEISCKGYFQKSMLATPNTTLLTIKLVLNPNEPKAEVYTLNSVNSIIKRVIENRKKNDPELALPNFQYKNYEYLFVTANADSIASKIDTLFKKRFLRKTIIKLDSTNYKFKKLAEKQHLYQTEKVSLFQHTKKQNKETVLATRMAGFQQPLYEYLGLKLVSFSVYDNPFEILEIPMQNPISKYGRKLYSYQLIDTLKLENRPVYKIYFEPKNRNSNKLRGLLYVDCETFAIAKATYKIYGIATIHANYYFSYLKDQSIWFPKKRIFKVLKGTNYEDINLFGGTIKFASALDDSQSKNATDQAYLQIESTPYDLEIKKPIVISKPKVAIEVPKANLKKPLEFWATVSKDTIDTRKLKTYTSLDSLSLSVNIEKKLILGRKIINGYFPISIVDLDLRSLVKYNYFEGFRLGLGGVTNSKLSNRYKIAFYGAYGFNDEAYKFGITPSINLHQPSETWLSATFSDDIYEIAQTNFVTDQRRYKIYDPRPINITTFYNNKLISIAIESKSIPKTSSSFSLTHNQIQPLFDYAFVNNNKAYSSYQITSLQFALQWNPFSNYMQTPIGQLEFKKRHPKFSLQLTQTLPNVLSNDFVFSKIDFKTYYELPYLSGQKSTVLLQTGLAFGDVPITHLYSIVPNNLNRDALLQRITFAGKNSFETMYFNEFFSNRYASLQLKHTFNKVKLGHKINPEFTMVTRMAVGSNNSNTNQHLGISYKTLEEGFFESGVECNKLFKGFGMVAFFRYGPNQLARFEDNLALKISYYLDLGI